MKDFSGQASDLPADWSNNYFNYFTEVEEHFRRARGSGLFLLSPLDWALIDSWRVGGIPLEAVLKGVDEAFEKWRGRKTKRQLVNSLAYCAQAVMEAAKRAPHAERSAAGTIDAPFGVDELRRYLSKAEETLHARPEPAMREIAESLSGIAAALEGYLPDLESLEQRLCAMEDKMVAAVRAGLRDEDLFAMRQALDAELRPYRGKMTAEQLTMLERRYLDRAVLEKAELPRLSLFYLQ